MKSSTALRVRVKHGEDVYDNDNATKLAVSQRIALRTAWNHDHLRMHKLQQATLNDVPQSVQRSQLKGGRHRVSYTTPTNPPLPRNYPISDVSSDDDEDEFSADVSSSEDGGEATALPALPPVPPVMETAIDLDIFGWKADPKVPYVPLVDLWLDLEQHLSSSDIPSPTELWKEQETIGAYVSSLAHLAHLAITLLT